MLRTSRARLLCAMLMALLALPARVYAADDAPGDDPTAAKLDKAKFVYKEKSERFKADLLKDLDAKETQARSKGDKKLVDQIKAERAAFAENGKLPKVVPVTAYETRVRQARMELETAYGLAIKDLVRQKQDDRATALEKELEALRAGVVVAAGSVDLLAMIDLAKDDTGNRWTRDASGLTVKSAKGGSALRIPYAPPEEYEIHATVARLDGQADFEIGPVWRGRRFYVVLEFRGVSGISFVDGKLATENETATRGMIFQGTDPANIVVTVKKASVTVTANGKTIVEYSGPPDRLSDSKGAKHPVEPGAMFLSTINDNSFRVTSLRLKPLTGEGKPLR